jgi:hypothetical protein
VIEDLANKVSAFTGAVSGFCGANHTNHRQFIDLSSVSFTSGQIHQAKIHSLCPLKASDPAEIARR